MEEYFNTLLQETERRMAAAAAGMEGKETVATCREMVSYLKAKKMDIIAYEFLAEAISTTSACRGRAADLLSGLACACADDETTQRFVRGVDGVWVFQP